MEASQDIQRWSKTAATKQYELHGLRSYLRPILHLSPLPGAKSPSVREQVHGGDDGDCDELRLLSDEDTVLNLRGHGGSLSFRDTRVR